jgi:hypothetical protein
MLRRVTDGASSATVAVTQLSAFFTAKKLEQNGNRETGIFSQEAR